MYLIYIDDSYDKDFMVFSAIAVRVDKWREVFRAIKQYRQMLKDKYDISIYYELHAVDFVKGRGSLGARRPVPKGLRGRIFRETLEFITTLPEVKIFNVCFPKDKEGWAFERLLNRINRTMLEWNSHVILICDEGKELYFTRLVRRMGVQNLIASKFGTWEDGTPLRNIPIERVVEDPIFKASDKSYFIQLADFCAYSLLKQESPTENSEKYGIGKAFDILKTIGVKATSSRDSQYVIRYK